MSNIELFIIACFTLFVLYAAASVYQIKQKNLKTAGYLLTIGALYLVIGISNVTVSDLEARNNNFIEFYKNPLHNPHNNQLCLEQTNDLDVFKMTYITNTKEIVGTYVSKKSLKEHNESLDSAIKDFVKQAKGYK